MAAWSAQTSKRVLGLVFLGTAVGLVFGFTFWNLFPEKCTDIDGFGRLASRFADDLSLEGSTRRGPLYPVLLGMVFRLAGAPRHEALILLHSLCVGLLGGMTYLCSLSVFKRQREALVTGLLVLLNPFVLWYVPRFWLEPVLSLLVLWLTYAGWRAVEKPSTGNLALLGSACGITSLCKAVALLFPLFLGLGLGMLSLLRLRPWGISSRKFIAFLLVPTAFAFLITFPWILRNRSVTGEWIPISSNLGIESFRGQSLARQNSWLITSKTLSAMLEQSLREEEDLLAQWGRDPEEIDDLEKNRIFRRIMWEDLSRSPHSLLLKVFKQIPAFWYRGDTWWSSLFFLGLSALFLTSLGASIPYLRTRTSLTWIVILLLIYLNLLHAGLVAVARYSLPLYPLMTLLIVPWFCQNRCGRRPRPTPQA